ARGDARPPRGADARAVEDFHRDGFVAARLLLQGYQDAILLAPRPDAALVDEGEPEAGVFGQREIEQAFVAGDYLQAHLGEHLTVVGDDGGEGDVVDAGGGQCDGLVAVMPQGNRESGLDEAIGEIGRGGRQVLLESAWDTLPFNGLQCGWG